ncbi:MAG TPA: riboflavin synthase [Chthoniobacterales bacterium]|jgi:riboflavin synthase
MFTGLIEEIGRVRDADAENGGNQLRVAAPDSSQNIRIGDSIAVNGCCLTLVSQQGEEIIFDLLEETVARTNLGGLRDGNLVNLERPIRAGATLDGHFVQGHIDCTSPILDLAKKQGNSRLEIALEPQQVRYVAEKGSIAVNGISLTVAEVSEESFVTWIIPHTLRSTNLKNARQGDLVNLEFDVLAKYVERMLPQAISLARPPAAGITPASPDNFRSRV